MQVATIVPQPHLNLIKDDNYHMCLAHLIGKAGYEEYTNFYANVGLDPNKYLIMDNGVIEGDPRPIAELVEKAKFIGAQEMVLPDVYQDGPATFHKTKAALQYLHEEEVADIKLMAVPQGRFYDDWLECAVAMCKLPVHTIGIPKMLVEIAGRDGRLGAVCDLIDDIGDKEIHLLGCWESPLELKIIENFISQGKAPKVRGVDSAIAFVYARAGMRIIDGPRPEGMISFKKGQADEKLLQWNIDFWKAEAAGVLPDDPNGNVVRIF